MQRQVSEFVEKFIHCSLDWRSLASLTIGGMAYRFGRIAVGSSGLGVGLGLVSEVAVFEGTHRSLQFLTPNSEPLTPNLWQWNGGGGLRQGLLTSLITFGSLKGAGRLAQGENIVLQHLVQDATAVLGHNLGGAWGLVSKPQTTIIEQMMDAEAVNLQMHAGMALTEHLLPTFKGWERKADLLIRSRSTPFLPNSLIPQYVPGSIAFEPRNDPFEKSRNHTMSSRGEGSSDSWPRELRPTKPGASLSDKEKKNLADHFRPLFPPLGREVYPDELLSLILSIPSPLRRFHEHLLTAYGRGPRPASLEQLYSARAIADLFRINALHQSTGSFHNSLLQWLISKAISEPSPDRRAALLQTIFETMETGPSVEKLRRVFQDFNEGESLRMGAEPQYTLDFWRRHGEEAAEAWEGYRESDKVLLFNLVQSLAPGSSRTASRIIHIFGEARRSGLYETRDIDAVLDFARAHALGKILLQRMLNVFAVEDIPAKLKELKGEEGPDTLESIAKLSLRGLSAEAIAEVINGTRHTAYIDDLRLSRKLVSVFLDVSPFLTDPQKRKTARSNLDEAFWTFLDSSRAVGIEDIFNALEVNPNPEIDSLKKSWREGKFLIEVLSKKDFDNLVRRWGKVDECEFCLFQSRAFPERDRILIREMPLIDRNTLEGRYRAYLEWTSRILGFLHEAEHWRHTSGNFEGIEKGSAPIQLGRIGRQERMVSEMMADLEVERWSAKYFSLETWEIARRLGENLVTYLRNNADQNYYGKTDRRMARKIMGSP